MASRKEDPGFRSRVEWMGDNFKPIRRQIQKETVQWLADGVVLSEEERLAAKEAAVMVSEPLELEDAAGAGGASSRVLLYRGDCLDAARWLQTHEASRGKVLVLDMANASTPGGGWRGGCGAQEESICRRSNLQECLAAVQYPIPECGAVYVPSLHVFRDSEANRYQLIETVEMSAVAVAAVRRPRTRQSANGEVRLTSGAAALLRTKIRTLMSVAVAHGHTAVVLSALGCGAFRNPPRHVAEIFRDVITSEEFAGRVPLVMFAIYEDHNGNNFPPFADVFHYAEVVDALAETDCRLE